MTPQERQMLDELFDRLSKLENAPRDPDAAAAISEGLRKAPNAVYALTQTVLLQDEALRRANAHIQELEAAQAPQPSQSGGFLDSMRETLFGSGQSQGQSHGSVPNVRPTEGRPVWNSGQVMQQVQPPGYDQPPYGQLPPNQGPPNQGYSAPPTGGGGSFLGTAAASAAGLIGGSLLLNSIRNMMGGSHQSFGDVTGLGGRSTSGTPWGGGDQSGSTLARDAGVGNIGSSQRGGSFDQAANDAQMDQDYDDDEEADAMDDDGSDFGGDDGGGDYA